jgi:3-hydroxyisobutyrate dehydrogenase
LWARRAPSLEAFAGTAAFAVDPVELGRASDVVGICVTDGAAVRDVTLGPRGVLAGMAEGSVLALHSTIGTDECTAIADAAATRGVHVIDAPVSGGGAVAAQGRLTVYVGGTDDGVARARPVLETYGDPVFHMGPLGSGLRTKLLNNSLNAAHFALAHDAFAVGAALGLDPTSLGDALRSGSGRSFSLEVFVGLRSFGPIADHVGPIMAKDIDLFERETAGVADRAALLETADRFLLLMGHPRPIAEGSTR